MTKKTEAVAELQIKFGKSVTSNNSAEKIAIEVNRSIGFTQADKLLCRKKIQVSICRDTNGQGSLPGMDTSETITAFADTGANVSFNRKAFKSSLLFNSEDVDHETLLDFAGNKAIMTVLSVEDLPEPEKKTKGKAATNGKTFDDHEDIGPRPIPGSPTLPLGQDQGSVLPVSTFVSFGLSENECEKLAAAMTAKGYGVTVGELEKWMAANEWWYRDIKGFGESKLGKLQDAHLSFRLKYPKPTGEDAERAQRAAEAYKQGCEAALAAENGKVIKNPHPERSPDHDGWQRGFKETKAEPVAGESKVSKTKEKSAGQLPAAEGDGKAVPR